MKTHRIILPAAQHAAALRGVDRLLLPLDRVAKARLSEAYGLVIKAANYFTGTPERGLGWYWKERGCWNSTEPFFPPYKRGDRMALLERFCDITFGAPYYEINLPGPFWREPNEEIKWQPASRMPLRACRCFYRVLDAEPVRECDTWAWAVRPVEPVNSGLNWAWAVRVESWDARAREALEVLR